MDIIEIKKLLAERKQLIHETKNYVDIPDRESLSQIEIDGYIEELRSIRLRIHSINQTISNIVHIRKAEPKDQDSIWQLFHEVVSKEDTYPCPADTSKEHALRIWINKSTATYVAVMDETIVGTYYIKPNQPGLGSHVCNCGYMVAANARDFGIGTAMCKHSQVEARRLGFCAMQFNLVVSSNKGAIRLWQKLGFKIIGTLPKAFKHYKLGYIDAHVMYKWLEE